MHIHNFRFLIVLSIVSLTLTVAPACATSILTYADLASWTAASTGYQTINFQSTAPGTYFSLSLLGVQFAGIGGPNNNGVTIIDSTSFGWNSGNAPFINMNQSQTMQITLPTAVTAFGFNVFSAAPHGLTFVINVNGTQFPVPTNDIPNSPTFFGVTSDTPLTTILVSLATNTPSAYILVDNVRFGTAQVDQTPEAATFLLIGSGLVGIMALRKRIMKNKPKPRPLPSNSLPTAC
jgi:PEP-CTERM motif